MIRQSGRSLVLRDWELPDLEPYQYWLQPGHVWQQYDGPYYPQPTEQEVQKKIDMLRGRIQSNAMPNSPDSLVIAEAHSNIFLGRVSRYWQSRETLWLSLGISLYDSAHWGRGLGFEALGLWCCLQFAGPEHLARLDLRTWSGNAGMVRLAEKLGFRREACFRKARIVDGQYFDALGFGVLREEWDALYPQGFAAFCVS